MPNQNNGRTEKKEKGGIPIIVCRDHASRRREASKGLSGTDKRIRKGYREHGVRKTMEVRNSGHKKEITEGHRWGWGYGALPNG